MSSHESFPSTIAVSLATAVCLANASCGPRVVGTTDPKAARAAFTSKDRSIQAEHAAANAQSGAPSLTVAPRTPAPVAATPAPVAATPAPVAATPAPVAAPATTSTAAATQSSTTPPRVPALAASSATKPITLAAPANAQAQADATQLLRAASVSSWAALRAHAIEASIRNPKLLAELAPAALADENRGVRFVACMSISEAKLTALADRVEPLLRDESPSVQAAAMLALARCGRKINLTPLASMIGDNDPEIRANAYLVLGELGERSAVPMIRESLGKGMRLINPMRVRLVDLAAAEALVKLGDDAEIEPIRAALFTPPEQSELTIVACDSIGRLHDEVARPMLERLLSTGANAERSPEIRLSAARALAKLGAKQGPAAIAREYVKHADPRIRTLAATLLGEIGGSEATAALRALLSDENPAVQVAAAGGLDALD
jgi:HEAT repeat protein